MFPGSLSVYTLKKAVLFLIFDFFGKKPELPTSSNLLDSKLGKGAVPKTEAGFIIRPKRVTKRATASAKPTGF